MSIHFLQPKRTSLKAAPRHYAMTAVLMALVASGCATHNPPAQADARNPVHAEAETGTLQGGTSVSSTGSGFSGTGYVTNFTKADSAVVMSVDAAGGVYDLKIHFRTPGGQKGFGGEAGGNGFSGMFPASADFTTFDVGNVLLAKGTNTIKVGGGWNYYDIDSIDLVPAAEMAKPLPVPATLSDP